MADDGGQNTGGMFSSSFAAGDRVRFDGTQRAEDFDAILRWAAQRKASDITISSDDFVRAEINGDWHIISSRPCSSLEVESFVRSIYGSNGPGEMKGGRDLDPSYEIRDLQTGVRERYRLNMTAGRVRNDVGFQMTFRALPSVPPRLQEDLGVEPDIIDNLRPNLGLNLVTGPTGSGKSTLLYAALRHLMSSKTRTEKVLDYSDPIEFVMDGIEDEFGGSFIWQTQVGTHLRDPDGSSQNDNWQYAVRNALRRKPNIILIGESRDRSTFEGCIQASQTGHLTFSTLHTSGVPETIRRALLFFPAEERRGIAVDMLDVLNLVVTQRLEKRTDRPGRVALREYLVFNQAVKDHLVEIDIEKWPDAIRKLMRRPAEARDICSQTMAEAATKLHDQGIIDTFRLRMIEKRYGGGTTAT